MSFPFQNNPNSNPWMPHPNNNPAAKQEQSNAAGQPNSNNEDGKKPGSLFGHVEQTGVSFGGFSQPNQSASSNTSSHFQQQWQSFSGIQPTNPPSHPSGQQTHSGDSAPASGSVFGGFKSGFLAGESRMGWPVSTPSSVPAAPPSQKPSWTPSLHTTAAVQPVEKPAIVIPPAPHFSFGTGSISSPTKPPSAFPDLNMQKSTLHHTPIQTNHGASSLSVPPNPTAVRETITNSHLSQQPKVESHPAPHVKAPAPPASQPKVEAHPDQQVKAGTVPHHTPKVDYNHAAAQPTKAEPNHVVAKPAAPAGKAPRKESIDDSWVMIEQDEVARTAKPVDNIAANPVPKAKEFKTETSKAVKKEKVPAASPGARRASTRTRHAIVEMPLGTLATHAASSSSGKRIGELIGNGGGMALGSIPHVSAMLNKKKSSDKTLLLVHRLAFGRPGEAVRRKSNLRQFNGFPPNSDGRVQLVKKLSTQTVPVLRNLCIFFNMERTGEKGTMASRIAEYLEVPKDFGKSRPVTTTPAKKKIAKPKAKKPSAQAKKATSSKKAPASKGKRKTESGLTPETVDSDEDDFEAEIESLKKENEIAQ